jgi:hypothetical protein
MANILFTRELGGGSGHLTRMRPLLRRLANNGHHVAVASWQPDRVTQVLPDVHQVNLRPALQPHATRFTLPQSFGHLLSNVGFSDPLYLLAALNRFDTVCDEIRPHVVIADHAPFSLLAAKGGKFTLAAIGTGFCIPPSNCALPLLTSRSGKDFQERAVIGL